jgi:hypothetical protein
MDPGASLVPSLGEIDPKGTYFLSGGTLIEIRDAIRSSRLKVDDPDNASLKITEVGPDGTVLSSIAGGGTIKVDDDLATGTDHVHEVDKAQQLNFIGPLCTVSFGGLADLGGESADVEIGPDTDPLDEAKKYVVVISYNGTRWIASWAEVCGSDTTSLALD